MNLVYLFGIILNWHRPSDCSVEEGDWLFNCPFTGLGGKTSACERGIQCRFQILDIA